ncbi:MAG: hypothetical protein C4334_14665 [Pyrinomonas sp.]
MKPFSNRRKLPTNGLTTKPKGSRARCAKAKSSCWLWCQPEQRARSEASRLRAEQAEIEREARRLEDERTLLQHEAEQNLERHHRFALVVTVLQVSIGLAAIAALVERRFVWYGALIIGAVGLALFVIGFLR